MTALQLPLANLPAALPLRYERDSSGSDHLVLDGELLPCAVFRTSDGDWHPVLFWRTDDGQNYTTLARHATREDAGQAAAEAFLVFVARIGAAS